MCVCVCVLGGGGYVQENHILTPCSQCDGLRHGGDGDGGEGVGYQDYTVCTSYTTAEV